MFLILLLHESAHLLMIKRKEIEISKLRIEPFGMRIFLRGEIIKNPADEISAALAGPLFSIFLGIFFIILNSFFKNAHIEFFAFGNLYIGIFNLLPALPLDGGRALRAFLSVNHGYLKSYNTLKKLTAALSFAFILSGILILFITKFNFSLCLTGAFLLFSLTNEKNLYTYYLNKELSGYKTKSRQFERMPVLRIAVNKNYPVRKILKELSSGRYCIVEVISGNKKLCEFTEGELLEGIIKKGSDISIEKLL